MNLLVEVEFCTNCHLHAWCSQHDEKKYQYHYERIGSFVRQFTHPQLSIQIRPMPVPKHYLRVSKFVPDNKYVDSRTQETVYFPRLGAFEVYINSKLIFTKLHQSRWPHQQEISDIILRICEAHLSHQDIAAFQYKPQKTTIKNDSFRIRKSQLKQDRKINQRYSDKKNQELFSHTKNQFIESQLRPLYASQERKNKVQALPSVEMSKKSSAQSKISSQKTIEEVAFNPQTAQKFQLYQQFMAEEKKFANLKKKKQKMLAKISSLENEKNICQGELLTIEGQIADSKLPLMLQRPRYQQKSKIQQQSALLEKKTKKPLRMMHRTLQLRIQPFLTQAVVAKKQALQQASMQENKSSNIQEEKQRFFVTVSNAETNCFKHLFQIHGNGVTKVKKGNQWHSLLCAQVLPTNKISSIYVHLVQTRELGVQLGLCPVDQVPQSEESVSKAVSYRLSDGLVRDALRDKQSLRTAWRKGGLALKGNGPCTIQVEINMIRRKISWKLNETILFTTKIPPYLKYRRSVFFFSLHSQGDVIALNEDLNDTHSQLDELLNTVAPAIVFNPPINANQQRQSKGNQPQAGNATPVFYKEKHEGKEANAQDQSREGKNNEVGGQNQKKIQSQGGSNVKSSQNKQKEKKNKGKKQTIQPILQNKDKQGETQKPVQQKIEKSSQEKNKTKKKDKKGQIKQNNDNAKDQKNSQLNNVNKMPIGAEKQEKNTSEGKSIQASNIENQKKQKIIAVNAPQKQKQKQKQKPLTQKSLLNIELQLKANQSKEIPKQQISPSQIPKQQPLNKKQALINPQNLQKQHKQLSIKPQQNANLKKEHNATKQIASVVDSHLKVNSKQPQARDGLVQNNAMPQLPTKIEGQDKTNATTQNNLMPSQKQPLITKITA